MRALAMGILALSAAAWGAAGDDHCLASFMEVEYPDIARPLNQPTVVTKGALILFPPSEEGRMVLRVQRVRELLDPKIYLFSAHGNGAETLFFGKAMINLDKVVAKMKKDPAFEEATTVFFLSCNAGNPRVAGLRLPDARNPKPANVGSSVLLKVAKETGKTVIGPVGDVSIDLLGPGKIRLRVQTGVGGVPMEKAFVMVTPDGKMTPVSDPRVYFATGSTEYLDLGVPLW